jgi:hypothetical protein
MGGRSRRAGILLANLSGIELTRGNGAQGPQETHTAPRRVEAAPIPPPKHAASPEPPKRPQKATGAGKEPERNKPLGFALTVDPSHPYLSERGIPPELVEAFGLGYCEKGIMAGRVCIPIHNETGRRSPMRGDG